MKTALSQPIASIAQLLAAGARTAPDAAAILAPGRAPLTHAALYEHVSQTAEALNALGIGRNDRVAVVLPNGPEMATAFLAVAACATCAPLNPAYRAAEFDFYLSDLDASALIVPAGSDSPAVHAARDRGIPIIELLSGVGEAGLFLLQAEQRASPARAGLSSPEDVALVLHTSGTTSRPKIVPLTQGNLCASARNIAASLELTGEDRCLNIMPLFHIHGLVGAVLSSLTAGGGVIGTPGFAAPDFFAWVNEFRPTWYTAVPTMHQAILAWAAAHRETLRRFPFRVIRSCSSALPPKVMAELEQTFGVPVLEAYGMTEASHQMTSNPLPPGRRKPGSVGRATGIAVAIMDEGGALCAPEEIGEVVIAGPSVMTGYDRNPAANLAAFVDGWLRTGDQGYLDDEGYLFLTGRLKELINRGGEKISPREIDEVLLDHPAVAQAVAFAVPDGRLGEDVASAVVLRPNASVLARELQAFVAARLADFKVPRRVLLVDEIPKGPTGKLQRIGLAERLGLTSIEEPAEARDYVAPRTQDEEAMAQLWRDVLRLDRVSVVDNFFQLGGDSLLATRLLARVRSTMRAEIPILSVFEEAATVEGMCRAVRHALEQTEDIARAPIEPSTGHEGGRPLSFAQEHHWLMQQWEPASCSFNRLSAISLAGVLDPDALARAIGEIVRRHELLRTVYPVTGGVPAQVVTPAAPVPLPLADIRGVPAEQREAEAMRLAGECLNRPFDLAAGPVFRVQLLRLEDQEHHLVLAVHHIAFDGWSMRVFIRELAAHYEHFTRGAARLPELPIQYADFARWQRRWLGGERLAAQVGYWKTRLSPPAPPLNLPADRPRARVRTAEAGVVPVALLPPLTGALTALARDEGATVFMALLAGLQALLHRVTGREDITVGVSVDGRGRQETEGLIGMFTNALAVRTDLSNGPTFRELVRRVRHVALGAYAHQDAPLADVLRALQPKPDPSRGPVFDVMFTLKNAPTPTVELPGLTLSPLETPHVSVTVDLALELHARAGGAIGALKYNSGLFDATTMEGLAADFLRLLERMVAEPDRPISSH